MTKSEINLFKKGSRCRICTGCGRCFGEKQVHTVSSFVHPCAAAEKADMVTAHKAESVSGDFSMQDYLVAVDIGTTTVAMQLREIESGRVADVYTCINPQRSFGADVLSRIEAAGDDGARVKMQQQILEVLQEGLLQFADKLCAKEPEKSGEKPKTIKGMSIAANTTMIHLLMGYDVEGLGKYPFVPQTVAEIRTELFDIDTVILPGVSAFVGADVMSGVYALSMQDTEEVTLLLDLGTNGEMVLGNKQRMIATSTAAGPAFEGGEEYFGTDLIKQVAALLAEGILDETGLMQEPYFSEGVLAGGVRITQEYVRQLQMAKAALCTGVRILCERYGLKTMDGIDKVYLAGGMGYFLDVGAAVAIGLLPKQLENKTIAVGNVAVEGAFLYGRAVFENQMSEESPSENQDWHAPKLQKIEEFNLATEPGFSKTYISGMDLKPCIE